MSNLFLTPFTPVLSVTGAIEVGAKVYFYHTQTLSLAPIYDASGTALANPAVSNLNGQLPAIYLTEGIVYRVILKSPAGVTQADIDPYSVVSGDFPDGIKIGTNELKTVAPGGSLDLMSDTPGTRGELRVIPDDAGGVKDPYAGGELTILMDDTREPGDPSVLTMRAQRNGSGVGQAFVFQSIGFGTGTQYPIWFDPAGGNIAFKLNIDSTAWFYGGVQIQGGGGATPSLHIGPIDDPSIDLDDTDTSGVTWRMQSANGNYRLANVTAGIAPLIVNHLGRPFFANLDSTTISTSIPARVDNSTGQLLKLAYSPPTPPPTATDLPTALTAINDIIATLAAYDIYS